MSGPICPDCGTWDFTSSSGSKMKCNICGWTGGPLPRKMLYIDDHRERSKRMQKYKERKAAGLLFFVRIYGTDKVLDDLTMDLFDILGIQESRTVQDYIIVEMNRRPTHEQIEKIESIKGVKKVTVF